MARHPDLGEDEGDEIAEEIDTSRGRGRGRGGRGGRNGGAGLMTGLVVGALVGAGLALLFAPDAGDVTRERLGRRLRDLRREGGQRVSRAARRGRRGAGDRLRSFIADAL